MERQYRSLILSDDWNIIQKAVKEGRHAVPCLPLRGVPKEGGNLSGFSYVLEDAENVEDAYLDLIDDRLCERPHTVLETARCLVREISLEDLPELYRIYEEPEITAYMEPLYEDREKEEAYTRDYIKWHYGFYGFGMWIVTDKTGMILGRAGFEEKGDGIAELGFMIRKQSQRQGYAYEVSKGLLTFFIREYPEYRIRSMCHKDNTASVNLLTKLGFITERENGKENGGENPCIFWEYQVK
ncbi:MAG: GNAT family N-acetyltransferase [Lachnospiraceae bacterium]|nr:GNAT family N-acetyltransferase [Lachnospiraceae bacterium]